MDRLTVLGLDLSPTSTGWGKGCGGLLTEAPVFGTLKSRITVPKTGSLDLATARLEWNLKTLGALVHDHDPDVIIMEGPAYRATGAYWHENAGLWWNVVRLIRRSGRPLAVITPATLKKFASGSGNAKKSEMCVAAAHRFGLARIGEDEADGLWLAAAGCQRYGWPLIKMPAAQVAALDVVKAWPALKDPEPQPVPV